MNIIVFTVNYFYIWKHYESSTKSEVYKAVQIYIVVFRVKTSCSLVGEWLPVLQGSLLQRQYTTFYHYSKDHNPKVAPIM
jgi:hypothetical protein